MAENTPSTSFHKENVDRHTDDSKSKEEEQFKEREQSKEQSKPEEETYKELNENEIITLLNQDKKVEALKCVLQNAPLGCKNRQLREDARKLVLKVLLAIKTTEIEAAVAELDTILIDTLMKYIYKGFETPAKRSSKHLLEWHEKVFAVGGHGCIVRVLTDRKRA